MKDFHLAATLTVILLVLSVSMGYAQTTTHKQMVSFEACLAVIAKMATDTGIAPVNIVETTAMRMVRFPVADGSVLVTCTQDGNLAMTQSTKRCGVDVEC